MNRLSDYYNDRTLHEFYGLHHDEIMQDRWFSTMDCYSKASLTFPDKDIFKALEGVGQHMAQLTDDIYQHGILRNTLCKTLLWKKRIEQSRRSPPQQAPSWHWASYEGGAKFPYVGRKNFDPDEVWRARISPNAYFFMSSDCKGFALGRSIDLWSSLKCIGRPIAVDSAAPDSNIREGCAFTVYARFAKISVSLDGNLESDTTVDTFVLLPLVSVQEGPGLNEEGFARRRLEQMCIAGIVLRATGKLKNSATTNMTCPNSPA